MNVTGISADDWIINLRLKRGATIRNRRIAVTPTLTEGQAIEAAMIHVNTLRMRLEKRAWTVLDQSIRRRWQLKEQAIT